MTTKSIRSSRLFFVRPKESIDSNAVAERLAEFEGVEEVLLTEGEYGFLVKAALGSWKEYKGLAKAISEISDNKCGMAISYYKYKND